VITPIAGQWKLFPDGIGVTNGFFRFTGFSAVILVLVFALALVHYLLFEGPSLRLRRRVTPKCLARA
jgi:peptidoglycan/LPS O-acetylase OafA/YrhL